MQRISIVLASFLFLSLFSSCKKSTGNGPEPQPSPVPVTGLVTPVGTPDDMEASEKTIGATGGSLISTDGRIKVSIPAGALSSNQNITIQTISNHNPMAIKKAYRIQPHGLQFSKPVSIEFSYDLEDIQNTIPEALGIAYQDNNRIWKAIGGAVINKNNKTIVITTTHFSDWSLFESFKMSTTATVLPVSGTAELEVMTYEGILAPLTPGSEVPIGPKITMPASFIKKWNLAGSGSLQPAAAKAVYRAPATVPTTQNPVGISVELDLKQRGSFLLVRNIEIQGDDGEIEIRVAGGNWVKKAASIAVRLGNGYYSIADSDGDTQGSYVVVRWQGELGTHPYKSPFSNVGTHVHYLITNGANYTCSYITGNNEFVASGGGVTITSMGEDDGFIKGTFTIDPAGTGENLKSTIFVEGKFRVRRGW